MGGAVSNRRCARRKAGSHGTRRGRACRRSPRNETDRLRRISRTITTAISGAGNSKSQDLHRSGSELLESIRRQPGDVDAVEEERINPRRHIDAGLREKLPGTISIGNDGSLGVQGQLNHR
jgi:hypothetical protein